MAAPGNKRYKLVYLQTGMKGIEWRTHNEHIEDWLKYSRDLVTTIPRESAVVGPVYTIYYMATCLTTQLRSKHTHA